MYIIISSLGPPEAKKALRRSPPGAPPGRARREALRGKTNPQMPPEVLIN